MSRFLLAAATAILLPLMFSPVAHAGNKVISTTGIYVNSGQFVSCVITNLDNKPREVVSEVVNALNGNLLATRTETVPPGQGVFVMGPAGLAAYHSCRFTVTGNTKKFRASVNLGTLTEDLIVVPAF